MKIAITLAFTLLDVFSGVTSALKNRTWTSTIMREGLFHKMAIVILIAIAFLCDYGQGYLDLGFTLPIADTVLIYVSVMEIGSVGENLIKINPELTNVILKLFKKEV